MAAQDSPPPNSRPPATHYELFSGLGDAGVGYLVTGGTALTLHGVPRLTGDIDLVVDPDPGNLERLCRLLRAWGYLDTAPPAAAPHGIAVRRFRHGQSALAEIDAVLVSPREWERLRAGGIAVALVDLAIPVVGAGDLRQVKEAGGAGADQEDAAALAVLASIRAGGTGSDTDTRREQIRKFSRWSVAARLDWLLAAARLARGLSPEAKPMTRGLLRRNPWFGR
jgi:CheY-like chemotaxis protein